MTKEFTVHLEGPSFTIDLDEIWPEGNAPDSPTPEDVAKVMRDYGYGLIRDWNLDEDLEVYINGYVKV